MPKKIRVAINGFGRIGRLTARILIEKYSDQIEIVAVNDLTDAKNLAYLFANDSTYRKFQGEVRTNEDKIFVNEQSITVLAQKDPNALPWGIMDIDIVLECTGRFLSTELANLHLHAGAKSVILSAPAKDPEILTVVQGTNIPSLYSTSPSSLSTNSTFADAKIVSNASCTTNCIAPALKLLDDLYKINQANAITVHAYTATQALQDGPSTKEWRDGRAAAVNLIPSKTGAAKAVELVLPDLQGKISLSSLRVPVISGSMIYLVASIEASISTELLNLQLKEAIANNFEGIIEFGEDEYVSSDIIGNSHSCVIDSKLTKVKGNTVELVLWYDNEWGYSNRLAELLIQKVNLTN